MLLAQDLYNVPSQPTSKDIDLTLELDPNWFSFPDWNWNYWIQALNRFALIWSIFLAFTLFSDFYFYYRKHADGELAREEAGEKSIRLIPNIWWRYLVCWLLVLLTALSTSWPKLFFFIFTVAGFFIKFWLDLKETIRISQYFPWYKNFADSVYRFLDLQIKWSLGKKK